VADGRWLPDILFFAGVVREAETVLGYASNFAIREISTDAQLSLKLLVEAQVESETVNVIDVLSYRSGRVQ
jgi:hypothetical protein